MIPWRENQTKRVVGGIWRTRIGWADYLPERVAKWPDIALRGVTLKQIRRANALMRLSRSLGIPVTWPEAIAQVTKRIYSWHLRSQRAAERQRWWPDLTLRGLIAERNANVRKAMKSALTRLWPATIPDYEVPRRMQEAARAALELEIDEWLAAERELLPLASGTEIDPIRVAALVERIDYIITRQLPNSAAKRELEHLRRQLIDAPARGSPLQAMTGVAATPPRYVTDIGRLHRVLCEWHEKLPAELAGHSFSYGDHFMADYRRDHLHQLAGLIEVHAPLSERLLAKQPLSWDEWGQYVALAHLNDHREHGPVLQKLLLDLQEAMKAADQRYGSMLAERQRSMVRIKRLRQSTLGGLARASVSLDSQWEVIFGADGASESVGDAVRRLTAEDPDIAGCWLTLNLQSRFDDAMGRTGEAIRWLKLVFPDHAIDHQFASTDQRPARSLLSALTIGEMIVIEAYVRALPDGERRWRGFSTFLAVLHAQAW